MKKMFALMLAAMMLLSMVPVFAAESTAYTQVSFDENTKITHELFLTDADMTTLPYDIIYTFTNVGGATNVGGGFTKEYLETVGSPTIKDIEYLKGTTVDATSKKFQTYLDIDWSKVAITEPGIYRWEFTKQKSSTDPVAENTTNLQSHLYLDAYVTISGSNDLTAKLVMYNADKNEKDNDLNDNYPAKVLSLAFGKTVTGNQGSKNQFFKFTVKLTSPEKAKEMVYQLEYNNGEDHPATAYNEAIHNPPSITVPANKTEGSVDIWLRHGDVVTISGLLFNTKYAVIETVPTDYQNENTKASIISGDMDATVSGSTVEDGMLTQSTQLQFVNHKNATTPTGITLQTAAPVAGMMLALAMIALLFVGKRKEEMA